MDKISQFVSYAFFKCKKKVNSCALSSLQIEYKSEKRTQIIEKKTTEDDIEELLYHLIYIHLHDAIDILTTRIWKLSFSTIIQQSLE